MDALTIVKLVAEILGILGTLGGMIAGLSVIANGIKCLLRSGMLNIYYKHLEHKQLRQYEYENFVLMYGAYKKLLGNSFIDKVYNEVKQWKVVS